MPYSTAYFYSKGKNNQKLHRIIAEKSARKESTNDEFFGDISIEISHVPALKKRSDYYVLQTEGIIDTSVSFYLVATIVRDNEMLMKNDQPYFYHAIDLTKTETTNDGVITSAFRLPKDLKGSDVLKIYAWNPQKKMQKLNAIKLFSITN